MVAPDMCRTFRQFCGVAGLLLLAAGPAAAQTPQQVAERWLTTLSAGRWADAAALVSDAVPPAMRDTAQLRRIWAQFEMMAGSLRSVQARDVTQQDSFRLVTVAASFERQQMLLRVVLTPGDRIAGLTLAPPAAADPRVPPYADTTRYREEPVQVGSAPWQLPGTLTVPRGTGRFPIVVLVHGSGPNDRDETFGPNRPFRDLALGLASRGIAVLRYDKRTLVHRAQMMGPAGASITVEEEVIEDALAALRAARAHPSIDAQRSYLLGHSLGGQLAPEIALRDSALAGVILLAAPARPVTALMDEQFGYLGSLPQNSAEAAQLQIRQAQEAIRRYRAGGLPDTALILGATVRYLRDLDARDAVAAAQRLTLPLLILQGERDYQVTMTDFQLWQHGVGSRAGVTMQAYAALNHHFIAGSGTPNPIEYMMPGHVAQAVIETIAGWIRR